MGGGRTGKGFPGIPYWHAKTGKPPDDHGGAACTHVQTQPVADAEIIHDLSGKQRVHHRKTVVFVVTVKIHVGCRLGHACSLRAALASRSILVVKTAGRKRTNATDQNPSGNASHAGNPRNPAGLQLAGLFLSKKCPGLDVGKILFQENLEKRFGLPDHVKGKDLRVEHVGQPPKT
jgi:hypothetical protein